MLASQSELERYTREAGDRTDETLGLLRQLVSTDEYTRRSFEESLGALEKEARRIVEVANKVSFPFSTFDFSPSPPFILLCHFNRSIVLVVT